MGDGPSGVQRRGQFDWRAQDFEEAGRGRRAAAVWSVNDLLGVKLKKTDDVVRGKLFGRRAQDFRVAGRGRRAAAV